MEGIPQSTGTWDAVNVPAVKAIQAHTGMAVTTYPGHDEGEGMSCDCWFGYNGEGDPHKEAGTALAEWIMNNAGPLEVDYIVYFQKIWNPPGGNNGGDSPAGQPWAQWRQMEDRGSPTQNHHDHVHVTFLGTGGSGAVTGGSAAAPAASSGDGMPSVSDFVTDPVNSVWRTITYPIRWILNPTNWFRLALAALATLFVLIGIKGMLPPKAASAVNKIQGAVS